MEKRKKKKRKSAIFIHGRLIYYEITVKITMTDELLTICTLIIHWQTKYDRQYDNKKLVTNDRLSAIIIFKC